MVNWLKVSLVLAVFLFANCKESDEVISEIPTGESPLEPEDRQGGISTTKFLWSSTGTRKTVLHGSGQDAV